MKFNTLILLCICLICSQIVVSQKKGAINLQKIPDEVRAKKIADMQYGPIELIWFDHAVGDGGLSHEETTKWVHQFQPNCFVGYNHGQPSGRLCLREMGKAGKLGDSFFLSI